MKLGIVKVVMEREVNAYVIACSSTKEAVVIDPGLPTKKLADQVKGLTVKYIIATHCHPGHVAGKDDLKTRSIQDHRERERTRYVSEGHRLGDKKYSFASAHLWAQRQWRAILAQRAGK